MKKLLALMLTLLFLAPAALAAEKGEVAPDAEFILSDGETQIKLSDYRGYVVVISMWATWCPGCVAEMPILQKLHEEYPGDVRVLAVNLGEDTGTVAGFLDENGYTFPVAMDYQAMLITQVFPSDYIPYVVVLGPDGAWVYDHLGDIRTLYDELVTQIETYSPYRAAQVALPGEAGEVGMTFTATGTVTEVAEGGFTLEYEGGASAQFIWAGEAPEPGAPLDVAGTVGEAGYEVLYMRPAADIGEP